MVSKFITRAATFGVLVLLPITAAISPASAQQHHRDDFQLPQHMRSGSYEVAAGVTKSIVQLSKPGFYRVCASGENADPVTVHFDSKKTEALRPGECHDFEAVQIMIENTAKTGFAHGTFFRRAV